MDWFSSASAQWLCGSVCIYLPGANPYLALILHLPALALGVVWAGRWPRCSAVHPIKFCCIKTELLKTDHLPYLDRKWVETERNFDHVGRRVIVCVHVAHVWTCVH